MNYFVQIIRKKFKNNLDFETSDLELIYNLAPGIFVSNFRWISSFFIYSALKNRQAYNSHQPHWNPNQRATRQKTEALTFFIDFWTYKYIVVAVENHWDETKTLSTSSELVPPLAVLRKCGNQQTKISISIKIM